MRYKEFLPTGNQPVPPTFLIRAFHQMRRVQGWHNNLSFFSDNAIVAKK